MTLLLINNRSFNPETWEFRFRNWSKLMTIGNLAYHLGVKQINNLPLLP